MPEDPKLRPNGVLKAGGEEAPPGGPQENGVNGSSSPGAKEGTNNNDLESLPSPAQCV